MSHQSLSLKGIHLHGLTYGGCIRSTNGKQTGAVLPKRHENVFFLAANKNKDNA